MAGVRIQHPTAKNGLFLVKHIRAYPHPLYCERCQEFHVRKTYHLELDADGCVIVSPVVLERLKEIGLAGFRILNEVKNPPAITIGIPGVIPNQFRVFEMGAQQEKPHGKEAQ